MRNRTLWRLAPLIWINLGLTLLPATAAGLKNEGIIANLGPSPVFRQGVPSGGGESDDQPKIAIQIDASTGDILVDVEASEIKPTDVFIDLDGKGFLFLAGFYSPSRFRVFPSIRHAPTVLFKAEKRSVVPGELPIDAVRDGRNSFANFVVGG